MELNIGDYVRNTDGEIGKIIECPEVLKENYGNWLWFETIDEQRPIIKEHIIKSSPNIIDLIEVGDLVKIENEGWVQVSIKFEVLKFFDNSGTEYLYEEIEAIITKEQIASMEYKIGE